MKGFKHLNSKNILIVIIGAISCFMFFQNFIACSSFSILSLRSIDDIAFQYILDEYFRLKGIDLLFMNDYGYGWIYWFPMYILTYPAYLIKQYLGVEWLLIVLPRMQSLVFSVGCSILMYKITCVYTKNHWARVVVVLCTPIYPIGAYYAGRFGTVAQTAFLVC